MTAGSYIIRGGVEGRERLRVMSRALRGDTTALLGRLGLRPGMRCLDAGCGGGDVTLELAGRVVPGGHVMGGDLDETKLDRARGDADRCAFDNVTYQFAVVTNVIVPSGVDLVSCHDVLARLPQPEMA